MPGGRDALPSCVLKEIREEVTRIADKYRVSRSWVVATTLMDAFRITSKQPRYDAPVAPTQFKRKRVA